MQDPEAFEADGGWSFLDMEGDSGEDEEESEEGDPEFQADGDDSEEAGASSEDYRSANSFTGVAATSNMRQFSKLHLGSTYWLRVNLHQEWSNEHVLNGVKLIASMLVLHCSDSDDESLVDSDEAEEEGSEEEDEEEEEGKDWDELEEEAKQ